VAQDFNPHKYLIYPSEANLEIRARSGAYKKSQNSLQNLTGKLYIAKVTN